ncbi:unnamed protein product [Trichobilharzia szidati]|nr:unnamed protein product [Trichobilharzia szidati]
MMRSNRENVTQNELQDVGTYCTGVGCRVVRGPDWKWNKQDGGEGHVGSVKRFDTSGEAIVVWDSGIVANYRCGVLGFDLRVLDSSPTGLRHPGTVCEGCHESPIYGIRWKCVVCLNTDLCSTCYHGDKHSLAHQFLRITAPYKTRVIVGRRMRQRRIESVGLFPKARVVRGIDWSWNNQDCVLPFTSSNSASIMLGSGSACRTSLNSDDNGSSDPIVLPTQGRITSRKAWYNWAPRSAATVAWDSGARNVYRVGYGGQVDLKAIRPAKGGAYYVDHLPLLADLRQYSDRLCSTGDSSIEIAVAARHDCEISPVVPNWTNLQDLESRRRQISRTVEDDNIFQRRILASDGGVYDTLSRTQCSEGRLRVTANVLSADEPAASSCLNVCTLASRLHLQPSSIESSQSQDVNSRRSHTRLNRSQHITSTDRECEDQDSPRSSNISVGSLRSLRETARTLFTDFLRTNDSNQTTPVSHVRLNSGTNSRPTNQSRPNTSDPTPINSRNNRSIHSQGSMNDHRTGPNFSTPNSSPGSQNQYRGILPRVAISNRDGVLALPTRSGSHNDSSSSEEFISGRVATSEGVMIEDDSSETQFITIQCLSEPSPRVNQSHTDDTQSFLSANVLESTTFITLHDESQVTNFESANILTAPRQNNGSEDLIQAARDGDVDRLRCLLQNQNADVNGTSGGLTALHAACQEGHLACVILLLQNGARRRNLDSADNEAIHSAARSGNLDVVRYLMRSNIDRVARIVDISEENNVNEGNLVDLDDNSPGAADDNNLFDGEDIPNINSRNSVQQTPLHLAVNQLNLPMAQCLLEEMNALPNLQDCDGDTPLHDAVSSQHTGLVRLLLRHNPDLTILNNSGQNVLHCAAVYGSAEITRLLLEHCALTPWIVDEPQPDGLTALHLASLSGNLEAVDLLLQAGASPNLVVRRPTGLPPLDGCNSEILGSVFTPLHLAVHRAHPGVVCILLCYRARAGCRSGAGRSPMQLALTALAENEESQSANVTRFDVALVPFLASVARILVRMADSLTLTSASTGAPSGSMNRGRLHQNRNNNEEQLIQIDNDNEEESNRNTTADSSTLTSPSPLCRRLKSTIEATLQIGVSRNVLIAACLASAIGAESWSSRFSEVTLESVEEDIDNASAEMISENFFTDIFRECTDPVLQLTLQQCHMEALNFMKCCPINSESVNRSPRREINQPNSPLPQLISDSDEENLVDALFQTDNRQISQTDLLPSCSVVGSNNSYIIQPSIMNQAAENPLNQPFSIENQLIPEPNNLHFNLSQSSIYTLLPPTLDDIDLEWRECLVCSERNRSTIMLPCGHIITCETCTPLIKKCLLCRQRITGYHKFAPCCECGLSNGVVLARPCSHMLWCKSCLETKVHHLEIIHQISTISFGGDDDDESGGSRINTASNNVINSNNLSLSTAVASEAVASASTSTGIAASTTAVQSNRDIDELDPLFSRDVTAASSFITKRNNINSWRNVPLGRLLSMITKLHSLLDELLTGGICLSGCPACGNSVQSLWPVIVACSGVNHQSTSVALGQDRRDSNPFTVNSSNNNETNLIPNVSNITNVLPTNNSVLGNVQTEMELVQNQLLSNKPPHNLPPMDNQTLSGLVNTSNRQAVIAPNNQLHQGPSRADIRGRPQGQRAPLCDREIRCPICLDRSRNLVFMCGHATCQWCGDQVTACPICRRAVESRIILY